MIEQSSIDELADSLSFLCTFIVWILFYAISTCIQIGDTVVRSIIDLIVDLLWQWCVDKEGTTICGRGGIEADDVE